MTEIDWGKDDTNWIAVANQIEDNTESITIRFDHYLFDHIDASDEKLAIIREFVEYCVQKDKEDLDAPRAPDGTSFNQRREAQLKEKPP